MGIAGVGRPHHLDFTSSFGRHTPAILTPSGGDNIMIATQFLATPGRVSEPPKRRRLMSETVDFSLDGRHQPIMELTLKLILVKSPSKRRKQ